MRQNPHVRICGGLGSATTLVYPTAPGRGARHPIGRVHYSSVRGPVKLTDQQRAAQAPAHAQDGSCRCHVHTCSGVTTLDVGSTAGSCYTHRFLLS